MGGQNIQIAANKTHLFCIDQKEFIVFDVDLVFLSRLVLPNNMSQISRIACSDDGTVICNTQNNPSFLRFTTNASHEYVSSSHSKVLSLSELKSKLSVEEQRKHGLLGNDRFKFHDADLLIQENNRIYAIDERQVADVEIQENGDLVLLRLQQFSFGPRKIQPAYCSTTKQLLLIQGNHYRVIETSKHLACHLQRKTVTPLHQQSYFGSDVEAINDISFGFLKTVLLEIITHMQEADLYYFPDLKNLNYTVSQTKAIYQKILKTKNLKILHLNLQMLARQGIMLNEATRSDTFEMEVLEQLKDDLAGFKTVWPFVGLETVKKFREKFPDYEYTKISEEELIWQELSFSFKDKKVPEDAKSIFGDIIRLHAGENVSRQDFQDQSAFVQILFGDFYQPNFDFAQFDGILSGGCDITEKKGKLDLEKLQNENTGALLNEQSYARVLMALKKLHENDRRLNLGGENANVYLLLTEQTFLAMITLNDLTRSLQVASNILSKVEDIDLVDTFKEDVPNFKLFDELWKRACQVQDYVFLQRSKLKGDPTQDEIDENEAKLVLQITKKCAFLQKMNVPFIIKDKNENESQPLRIVKSFENDSQLRQLGATYTQFKQKLLKKEDDLNEKAEAIAQSVLLCLKSDCSAEDFGIYLQKAEELAIKRLQSFQLLLKSVTQVQQNQLAEFINFLIDFQLSPEQQKYSYYVSGVVYENQTKIQSTFFLILKKIHERCHSDIEKGSFLRLINSIRFTARDFGPMLQTLNIFELLYQIKDSENTVNTLLDQILLRLDDEKQIVTKGLTKNISRLNAAESNQLLSSQIDTFFVSEMECLIKVWNQIETDGPITKQSYQKLKARFTDELILQCLVEVDTDNSATENQIKKARIVQQKKLLYAQLQKYGNIFALFGKIEQRLDNHSQLLQLFTSPKVLGVLLSSLAVLNTSLATLIVEVLVKVFTHKEKVPTHIVEESCKLIWPAIQSKVPDQSHFISYLLGLATYIQQPEHQVIRVSTTDFCSALCKLAATYVSSELLQDFAKQPESRQLQVLQVILFSFELGILQDQRAEILNRVEGFLNESISMRVTALILSLLMKGGISYPKPETVVFLTARCLFSNFETFDPDKIRAKLKLNYNTIEKEKNQKWMADLPGLETVLSQDGPIQTPVDQMPNRAIRSDHTTSQIDGGETNPPPPFSDDDESRPPRRYLGPVDFGMRNDNLQRPNRGRSYRGSIPHYRGRGGFAHLSREQQIEELNLQENFRPSSLPQFDRGDQNLQRPARRGGFGYGGQNLRDGNGIDEDDEQALLERVMRDSLLENQRRTQDPFLARPETEGDSDSQEQELEVDSKSDENEQREASSTQNISTTDFEANTSVILPKFAFVKQVLQLIDCVLLPLSVVFDVLKAVDGTLAVKLEAHKPEESDNLNAQLQNLLVQIFDSLSKEQITVIKTSISKAIINQETPQQAKGIYIKEKAQIQAQKTDLNWIANATTEHLEESLIECLAQDILVQQLKHRSDRFTLYVAAKHFMDLLLTQYTNQETSGQIPSFFKVAEQAYLHQLSQCEPSILLGHIKTQTNIVVALPQQKFQQLILYATLEPIFKDKLIVQNLKTKIFQSFCLIPAAKMSYHLYKALINILVVFINAYYSPKDLENKKDLEGTMEKAGFGLVTVGLLKQHIDVLFVDLEKPLSQFEGCVAIIKDFMWIRLNRKRLNQEKLATLPGLTRRLAKVLEGSPSFLAALRKEFSDELVHKVQRALRDDPSKNDFKEEQDEAKRQAAEYILSLAKGFRSLISSWHPPYVINQLANDPCKSLLKNLALGSIQLIPYDLQQKSPFKLLKMSSAYCKNDPEFRFDRHLAQRLKDSKNLQDKSNPMATLFSQLLVQIKQRRDGYEIMRRNDPNDRAFQVNFISEGATDAGGPYRELLESICKELMSNDLPLLIDSGNNGMLLNFDCQNEEYFVFFGVILGYAIRSSSPLTLDLHPVVWKQINNTELTDEDLETTDLHYHQRLEEIGEAKQEQFESEIDECFKVELRNGTECQLLEDGANTKVTFENRDEFIQLATQAHLHVADKQADWVRKGVEIICGEGNLAHMYWRILEERACGQPNIDINYLRKHTTYGNGLDPLQVEMFWQVLEEFSHEERVKYLQFVYGRGKLPTNLDTLQEKHRLLRYDNDQVDQTLPKSHTCSFQLELPRYTSKEIMKNKILIAINNCSTMDLERDVWNGRNPQNRLSDINQFEHRVQNIGSDSDSSDDFDIPSQYLMY